MLEREWRKKKEIEHNWNRNQRQRGIGLRKGRARQEERKGVLRGTGGNRDRRKKRMREKVVLRPH